MEKDSTFAFSSAFALECKHEIFRADIISGNVQRIPQRIHFKEGSGKGSD